MSRQSNFLKLYINQLTQFISSQLPLVEPQNLDKILTLLFVDYGFNYFN